VLVAQRDYPQGAPVMDAYGPDLSPADLLLDYGTVDPHLTTHRYEAAWGHATLPPATATNQNLLQALQDAGGEPQLVFGCSGPESSTLAWARAALAPEDLLRRLGWNGSGGESSYKVLGALAAPLEPAEESRVLKAVAARVEAAAAAYPSTLEDDLRELQGSGTTWPRQQVLRALASEKQALRGTSQVLAHWRQLLLEGCPPAEAYSGRSIVGGAQAPSSAL